MKAVILLSLTLLYVMYSRASVNVNSRATMLTMSQVSGNRLLWRHPIQRSLVRSLAECVQICSSDISKCKSIAYYKDIGSCVLYGVLPGYKIKEMAFPSSTKLYDVVINRDCTQVEQLRNRRSGVYNVKPCASCSTRKVYCDMKTEDLGWTVLQRRRDGSVDFYRNWDEYADGFGDLCNEFWIGNEFIHKITSSAIYELRVDLIDYDGKSYCATYDSFRIENASDKYRLRLGNYINSESNIGDALSVHGNFHFTTKDEDNDNRLGSNCAIEFTGAWWFRNCFAARLNGVFSPIKLSMSVSHGISWQDAGTMSSRLQFIFSEMKIRRIG
ncbi:ficolin-2-like [Anneissia japonica]|uniref:ficolin-2-like n=1 Tax=Anneissia japonica TaxID=1529436 RepID=UPI001425873E|nr:ficolin-2-like [Anneissia japonica]